MNAIITNRGSMASPADQLVLLRHQLLHPPTPHSRPLQPGPPLDPDHTQVRSDKKTIQQRARFHCSGSRSWVKAYSTVLYAITCQVCVIPLIRLRSHPPTPHPGPPCSKPTMSCRPPHSRRPCRLQGPPCRAWGRAAQRGPHPHHHAHACVLPPAGS